MAGRTISGIRVEYMPVADLPDAPRNPKMHEVDDLVRSMKRWGYTQPELIDERTGKLVAGHGRKEALLKMQVAGDPPPARIRVKNGTWLVPVLRGIAFASDQEAEAYLLADNKLVEAGGWDREAESAMIRELSTQFGPEFLDGIGYGDAELKKLLDDGNPDEASDQSGELNDNFQIVVTCQDEKQQTTLLARFTKQGLTCRALI